MAKYYGKIGESTTDNLLNALDITIVTGMRKIRAGQGVLPRGSALALSSGTAGDHALVLLGTVPAENETLDVNAILCDDIDTGASTGEAVNGEVYLTGHFNRNALKIKDNAAITDEQAEQLRTKGIFLDDMMK